MKWILEKDRFEEQPKFIKACEMLALPYELLTSKELFDRRANFTSDCIYYGGIDAVLQLRKFALQVWIDINCNAYYPSLPTEAILNNRYILLPYGELIRQKINIFGMFGAEQVFIRPNSGFKQFTGYLVSYKDWEREIRSINMWPDELVLISGRKNILREWRLVIAGADVQRVVSGSKYMEMGEIVESPDRKLPEKVVEFANSLLNDTTNIYPAWTMDVCELETGLQVVEINSFSCAGLYGCDILKVVDEVTKATQELICG
jgi:hypothetical protein